MAKKQQVLVLILFLAQICIIPSLACFRTNERMFITNNIPNVADIDVVGYTIPGILSKPSHIIKIGILGDIKDISGIHTWKGAYLAAKQIIKHNIPRR
jgi:hypothetical protein